VKLFAPLAAALRAATAAAAAGPRPPITVPISGQWGISPQQGYLGYSRAYMHNEIVFAAIEMLATSAGEPHIVGRRWQRNSPEIRNEEQRLLTRGLSRQDVKARLIEAGFFKDVPAHPAVRLLAAPNPWLSRGQLWGTVVMDRALAGNSYLLKARVQNGPLRGTIAELWRLRPDRVRVVPDAAKFIAGYEYTAGSDKQIFAPNDIIHFKTRHPLNDYYGMPPLMAIASRVDIDDYMKTFLRTFFERGGTGPGSILSIKQKLAQEAKDEIRERMKTQLGGPQGFHEMLVLDQAESTYQQLGLNRGLRDALPKELDAMQEARIAMAFGIPGSILGLLIGYESSSYANKRQDWQVFWDLTMTPLLSDLDDALNLQLVPDFNGIDEVLFDLSDIRALQEDVDKVQERHRKNLAAGAESWQEVREAIGLDPKPREGVFFLPTTSVPVKVREVGELPELPEPEPAAAAPAQIPERTERQSDVLDEVRHECGKLIAKDVEGNPELFCGRCKVNFRPHGPPAPTTVVKTVERDEEGRVARVVEVTG